MESKSEIWLNGRTCPHEWQGRNLAEYRRAELRVVAKEMGYPEVAKMANATQQQLLKALIVRIESEA